VSTVKTLPPPSTGGPLAPEDVCQTMEKLPLDATEIASTPLEQGW